MKEKERISIFNPLRLWKYLFKKPVTIPFKDIFTKKNANYLNQNSIIKNKNRLDASPRQAPPNTRGFHTNDWDDCIGCSTCEEICPTEAITMVERLDIPERAGEHQQRPVIDYGRCCFCALCVDTCTTGSLEMSNEYIYSDSDPDTFVMMPEKRWQGQEVGKGWVKDETSDLLALERVDMPHENIAARSTNFIEIVRGYSKETAMAEAARCVECGVCTSSCPVQMHIPEYIRAIWEDDIEGGLRKIYETNPLPGVCGRVCTHNCETACSIAVRGEAIAIRWLKRYIIDSAPNDIYERVIQEDVSEVIDGKVAVVGSGPAGLGAAYYLRVLGYDVDVYEEMPLAGGVMRYGIPSYRLPDTAIDKDIDFIKHIGVNIKTNTRVGKDVSLDTLEKDYDAVFLGTGFFKPRGLNITGSDHDDVIGAMDFLPKVREFERGNLTLDDLDVKESIVVIGGGDVAFDVARSATRIQKLKYGKSDVKLTSLENEDSIPASDDEYVEGGEEGIEFHCGNGPQEVMQENGNVTGLRLWECLCIFDETGNFNPEFDSECEKIITGKQIYIAIGQAPDYDYIPDALQEKIEIVRGKIKANEFGQLEKAKKFFVGGDIFRGPDLISGVADGHRAAQGIDDYLYHNAKQKDNSKTVQEMRDRVRANTPELTPKQRGIK
ncbi:MAG: FAD-dependent oxidoreductase [Candidatus Izimaplasma sp.]|nr:FAD-dependent oxidoreductase [Candidatus Izimaplasma bacterium]